MHVCVCIDLSGIVSTGYSRSFTPFFNNSLLFFYSYVELKTTSLYRFLSYYQEQDNCLGKKKERNGISLESSLLQHIVEQLMCCVSSGINHTEVRESKSRVDTKLRNGFRERDLLMGQFQLNIFISILTHFSAKDLSNYKTQEKTTQPFSCKQFIYGSGGV